MAYKPILFNTEMVQAIQAGRKTQTRRIVKNQDGIHPRWNNVGWVGWDDGHGYQLMPPCKEGDILWVRETWTPFCIRKDTANNAVLGHTDFCYKASPDCMDEMGLGCKWHPSIHMPKEAARIFLRVKEARVERLQDITVLDAISEGCGGTICDHADAHPTLGCTDCLNTGWLESPDAEFAQLWDSTIKPADLDMYGWDANPWVWVIEFERCEKPNEWC